MSSSYDVRCRTCRRGLSLMEVLFAIGVLMIGILGIAALLPVGTRNAAGALRSDATSAAIENQVSGAMGRLGGRPDAFDFPVPSRQAFSNASGIGAASGLSAEMRTWTQGQWLLRRTTQQAVSIGPLVDPLMPPPVNAAPAAMAPAFCIDPAFLAAANNLRNDNGNAGSRPLNNYDRTKFPCFDVNYHPAHHPGAAMAGGSGWPMTPRMFRVSLNSNEALAAPASAVARVLLSERDGLPLTKPRDATLPPSLLFTAIGDASRLDVQRSGAFSSIVMLAPTNAASTSYEVSVVVFEGRQTTTNAVGLETTNPDHVFPLAPFGSSLMWPNQATAAADSRTYPDEVMGIVTASVGTINGGVGRFRFVHSAACNPEVKVGQWLMLARWDSIADVNRYGWYRISDVLLPPVLETFDGQTVYRTEVEVRGSDWLFHPAMVINNTGVTNGSLRDQPSLLVPFTPPSEPAWSVPALKRNATIVVKAPKVVAVRSVTF